MADLDMSAGVGRVARELYAGLWGMLAVNIGYLAARKVDQMTKSKPNNDVQNQRSQHNDSSSNKVKRIIGNFFVNAGYLMSMGGSGLAVINRVHDYTGYNCRVIVDGPLVETFCPDTKKEFKSQLIGATAGLLMIAVGNTLTHWGRQVANR